MELLAQHEAFLRAISDAPDDDTLRLVYADFLQEQGDEEWAELIRVQCALARSAEKECLSELYARAVTLMERVVPWHEPPDWISSRPWRVERGFWFEPIRGRLTLSARDLANPQALRWTAVRVYPQWFGEHELSIGRDMPLRADHVHAMLDLPFVQQVVHWNLGGHIEELSLTVGRRSSEVCPFVELNVAPSITTAGVEVLAQHRLARRVVSLDLRNNSLDNDAARALVKSPYLGNLKRLQLLEGNRLRGRVWQQVIERFGEDVVE